jgi:predicted DNA-binding protein
MNETEMLQSIVKKKRRNANTIRYGMFGLSLGEEHYQRLDKYCTKHSIYKATLVRNLVVEYLDKVEQKDN